MSTFLSIDTIYRDRVEYPNPCKFALTPGQVASWFKYAREVRAYPQNTNKRPLEFVTSASVQKLSLPYPRISLYATESIIIVNINAAGTVLTASAALPAWFVVGTQVQVGVSSNGLVTYKNYYVENVASPNFSLDIVDPPVGPVAFMPGSNLQIPLFNATTDVVNAMTDALAIVGYPRLYLNYYQGHNDRQLINCIDNLHSEVKFVLFQERVQYDGDNTAVWIDYYSRNDQVMRIMRDFPPNFVITTRNQEIVPFFTDLDLSVPANPDKQVLIDMTLTPYIRDALYTNSTIETVNI